MGKKVFNREAAFTMIELIIVVVIIGIIASFAVPSYYNARIKVEDRNAQSMLMLIQQAERVYKLEIVGSYVPCGSTADCNSRLNLDIQGGTWTYTVPSAAGTTFCAQATGGGTGDWYLDQSMDEPATGACP